ncbi:hypothetical protein E4U53_004732 [Claviceps sorghi]|nr:hypothetical protein E4U53_004732 [Claviceps sorghi]
MPKPQDHDRAHHAHHAQPGRGSHGEGEGSSRRRHRHRHRHTSSLSPSLSPSRSRSRSRSPGRRHDHGRTTTRHRRSASPESYAPRSRRRRHRDESREKKHTQPAQPVVRLPFSARRIGKADYGVFEPLFAHYLDLQKQKDLWAMDEREARGRWKSFAKKWNRGELVEGWYDPDTFAKCASEYEAVGEAGWASQEDDGDEDHGRGGRAGDAAAGVKSGWNDDDGDGDGDGDDYAPVLPGERPRVRAGAKSATMQELSLRDELVEEERATQRQELRQARREDRALQKERLEELVPRAEAGTRERKLEKKKEVNEVMRQFRDKSPGVEVAEAQLMGGGDGVDDYKREREKEKRRRTARQIRREEFERAKMEEMEHRRKLWREREAGTVDMLRELARQRFG